MKAKITRKGGFKAAPLGYITENFAEGSTVEGKVAEWAIAAGAAEPIHKRARKADGQYKADDPSTPDVNEAYEPPKKKRRAPKNKMAKVPETKKG